MNAPPSAPLGATTRYDVMSSKFRNRLIRMAIGFLGIVLLLIGVIFGNWWMAGLFAVLLVVWAADELTQGIQTIEVSSAGMVTFVRFWRAESRPVAQISEIKVIAPAGEDPRSFVRFTIAQRRLAIRCQGFDGADDLIRQLADLNPAIRVTGNLSHAKAFVE